MLIAFTVMGGSILAARARELIAPGRGALAALSAAGALFILAMVSVSYYQAIRELRRRRRV